MSPDYLTPAVVIAAAVYNQRRLTRIETKLDGLPCPADKRSTMKTTCLLVLVFSLAFVGCSTSGKLPIRETVTVSEVTNATPQGVEIVTTTNRIYTVAETWKTGLEAGRTVAPALPSPWGEATAAALGFSVLVLGFVARLLTRWKGRAETNAKLLETVIDGVELANSTEVKRLIKNTAIDRGTQPDLAAVVNERTKGA
jgi:hypothetical protein